jgi:hypothetical protein
MKKPRRPAAHLLAQPFDVLHYRFHVDDMSSAHVYLRLPEGANFDDIPPDTLEDCAQLVKQNSIQGEGTLSFT